MHRGDIVYVFSAPERGFISSLVFFTISPVVDFVLCLRSSRIANNKL